MTALRSSILALLLLPVHAAAQTPVHFADANLKAAVEAQLGKANPTPTDMLNLLYLRAVVRDISDLTGLEYATNLSELDLSANPISNLSPLAGLTNLGNLTLANNPISDLSPLAGLTNLHSLYMGFNQISNLSPLADLTNLKNLNLENNQISNLSPVAGLTKMQSLHLRNNQIADISALAGLTDLIGLDIWNNQVSDISVLMGLLRLGHVNIKGNPLNPEAYNVHIPQLTQRGVVVQYDPPSAQRPAVSTQSATDVGQTSATLRGLVTSDGGQACQYRFRYRVSGGSYSHTTWTGSLTTGQTFSESVSGLTPGSTYYFSAQAKNSAGESDWGSEQSFATGTSGSVPTVASQPATNVGQTSATLRGSITNDGGQACEYRFRWRRSGGAYGYTSWTGSVTTGQSFTESISGLTSSSTYYFNAQARNSAGESPWGGELSFTTGTSVTTPSVTTQSALSVSQTSATLQGRLDNDGGESCQYSFRYKKSGGTYTYLTWAGSITTGQSFTAAVSGLTPASTYYFNAKARNSAGESAWGGEQSFTTGTSTTTPSVSTLPAVGIGETSATLRGRLDNDGGQTCQYGFRYKKSGDVYNYLPWAGSVTTGQSFSESISGLAPGSTYYFNAKARNSAGESPWGSEQTFTTSSTAVSHTLTISSNAGGYVSTPGEGTFAYNEGAQVQLRAEANSGYRFTHWSGTIWSSDNPTTITMNQDHNVAANFEPTGPQTPDAPVLTEPGSPSQPGPAIGTLTPTLKWQAVPGADYYALAISEYPYGREHVIYNPQQLYATTHTVPGNVFQYGKKYRWNTQAHSADGWSNVSATLYFRTTEVALHGAITLVEAVPTTAGEFGLT